MIDQIYIALALNRTIPVFQANPKAARVVPFQTGRKQFQTISILVMDVVQHEQLNLSGDQAEGGSRIK